MITIPEVSENYETAILADTPPHTPCGIIDSLPESPTNCSVESLIVSLNSGNGVTYAFPQCAQNMVNPGKYRLTLQPKVDSNSKLNKPITIIPKSSKESFYYKNVYLILFSESFRIF